MAGPMYFQVLSEEQANPAIWGAAQRAAIAGQNQQNYGRMLQNAQSLSQLPYAQQMAQADLANKQAQAPYMQSETAINQAALPYAGYKFMSPYMGNIARMQQAYNGTSSNFDKLLQNPQMAALVQNHPELVQSLYNTAQTQANTLNTGQIGTQTVPQLPMPGMQSPQFAGNQQMPATMPMQTLPQTPQQVQQLQKYFPTNGLTQQDIQDAQNANGLKLQKSLTDATARQKNLYATNIDKTLNQINPDDLTQYAGFQGNLQRLGQAGLASAGKESKSYDNYLTSLNAANLLATQVRQFYGDSIQPSMIKRLEDLTNPSTWTNNPTVAKNLFNKTKQILGQETGTYRQAMQSTAPYQVQGAQPSFNNAQAQMPTVSKVFNGTTYHKINGNWYAQ